LARWQIAATKNPRRETQAGISQMKARAYRWTNRVAPLVLALMAAFFKATLLEQADAQVDFASPLHVALALSAQVALQSFSPACNAGTRANAANVRHRVSFFIDGINCWFGCMLRIPGLLSKLPSLNLALPEPWTSF
jgi:hypothetical protein